MGARGPWSSPCGCGTSIRLHPCLLAALLAAAAFLGLMLGRCPDTVQRLRAPPSIIPQRLRAPPSVIPQGAPPSVTPQSAPPSVTPQPLRADDGAAAAAPRPYAVLDEPVWSRSEWGSNCSSTRSHTLGAAPGSNTTLCDLPHIWRNCSAGIYIDVGTSLGGQIRKLYHPQQFPEAKVLPLYDSTYGPAPRNGVCVLGVEANPVHAPYLHNLGAYLRARGHQALILTHTAASVAPGRAVFHLDHGSPVEWGASLSGGIWQRRGNDNRSMDEVVQLLDLPAFISDVVAPIAAEVARRNGGKRPPVGMKVDVEGEEWALLPALIVSGGLCALDMVYLEPHSVLFRRVNHTNMTIEEMNTAFGALRKANPRCRVHYTHIDDETYLFTDQVPLPP